MEFIKETTRFLWGFYCVACVVMLIPMFVIFLLGHTSDTLALMWAGCVPGIFYVVYQSAKHKEEY